MSPTTRLLLYAAVAVVALIVLIARFKLHPFVALITVSLALGLVAGMSFGTVVKSFQDGVAAVLGFIAIVVGLGTMLGKMMAESGGATRIATTLIDQFGERRVHWAIMFVAFIVGIPVFFQVGFVLLIPLVFTIARRSGLSLVKIGIPLVAGLSVVHGMVPPHPAATLAVVAFQADLGLTMQMHFLPHHAPAIGKLAAQFRSMPVILDHMGRAGMGTPAAFEEVLKLAKLPKVYFKFSGVGYSSKQKPPHADAATYVRRAFDAFGAERILWGGLGHDMDQFKQAKAIFDHHFAFATDAQRVLIRGANAAKLFGFA